jgi:hypothetical protein
MQYFYVKLMTNVFFCISVSLYFCFESLSVKIRSNEHKKLYRASRFYSGGRKCT